MGFKDEKSILKSDTIKKVLLNKKDYKFQDFRFKYKAGDKSKFELDEVEVYDFDVLILKLKIWDLNYMSKMVTFEVAYFNPQTNNDLLSINHIIAVFSDLVMENHKRDDKGNADVINNQFIFRKKGNYYTYVKIWTRGVINEDNYDKFLSYEFATNEYVSYVKKIFVFKKIQRRKIKNQFKEIIDKIILLEGLKNGNNKK